MGMRVLGFLGASAVVGAIVVGSVASSEARQANPAAAKITNPVASTPESIAAGGVIFQKRCSGCHGADAKGGPPKEEFLKPAPNLIDDQYDHGSSDGEMFYVIKNGVPPELVMDGWGERLSDTDMWNIVNYLRAQAKKSQ
jgi:cytochrome c oxidase cbb3-type subunit 3